MLTKFDTSEAYTLVIKKLVEYEDINNSTPITNKKSIAMYEHLCSMAEHLASSLTLGSVEVLLNIAEVDSLVRDIVVTEIVVE
ncbi:hypothetical protein [Chryseobacterium sp.]|uniref:hypothetical protein n=1 Tax=Chryseobacterium sp. TaxID=1871047 RepID=UPI00321B4127